MFFTFYQNVHFQPIDDKIKWQKVLYQKIGGESGAQMDQKRIIDRILSMAKVMHGLHTVCTTVYV